MKNEHVVRWDDQGDSRYNVENVYKMENNRKTKGMVQVLWRFFLI